MKLLDTISVKFQESVRHIELYHGDLTNIQASESVDLLIISAFPEDYTPTPDSLIGRLYQKGLSVSDLAQNKAADLRAAFSCWLSPEIEHPNFGFKRILCFEPLLRGKPPEVIGEIFQSLMPFAHGTPPISKVAMPLVATGQIGESVSAILEPLIEASVKWLELGLPVEQLKIVEISEKKAKDASFLFADLKKKFDQEPIPQAEQFNFHLFISYCHQNTNEVDFIVEELRRLRPDVRIFLDRKELNVGAAWQQKIFEALDDCKLVVSIYSPSYLQSKVCKEEFNIALFRHRKSNGRVLFPVYLQSAELPTYMELVQYADCRECNQSKLAEVCKSILKEI